MSKELGQLEDHWMEPSEPSRKSRNEEGIEGFICYLLYIATQTTGSPSQFHKGHHTLLARQSVSGSHLFGLKLRPELARST